MRFRCALGLLFVSLQTLSTPVPCVAKRNEGPALLQAVTFALTGGDNESNVSFNLRSCDATVVGSPNITGHTQTLTFHLNEIFVDRINIKKMRSQVAEWIEMSLNGAKPVVEEADIYNRKDFDPGFEEAIRKGGENVAAFLAEQHNSFKSSYNYVLTLYTPEADRLVRAWKYIYSHGCTGQRSPF